MHTLLLDSAKSSSTFNAWATKLRQHSSQRAKSARLTSGGASSSWPTPRASENYQGEETAEAARDGSAWLGAGRGATLTTKVSSWPTPRAEERGAYQNEHGDPERPRPTLEGKAESAQWPTPQAHDAQGSKTPEQIEKGREAGGVINLNETAEHWQTPQTDSFRSRGGDRVEEQGLDQQARDFWTTPQAHDAKGGMRTTARNSPDLDTMAEDPDSGLPVPPISLSGDASSSSTPDSRPRLNPRFVEWLMGWPPAWVSLEPTNSESSATALSLWRRRMRSSLSRLISG